MIYYDILWYIMILQFLKQHKKSWTVINCLIIWFWKWGWFGISFLFVFHWCMHMTLYVYWLFNGQMHVFVGHSWDEGHPRVPSELHCSDPVGRVGTLKRMKLLKHSKALDPPLFIMFIVHKKTWVCMVCLESRCAANGEWEVHAFFDKTPTRGSFSTGKDSAFCLYQAWISNDLNDLKWQVISNDFKCKSFHTISNDSCMHSNATFGNRSLTLGRCASNASQSPWCTKPVPLNLGPFISQMATEWGAWW